MDSAMLQLVKAIADYLGNPKNQLPTFALICLFGFAWYNIRQASDHYMERAEWRQDRERLITAMTELRRDVFDCRAEYEKLKIENAIMRSEMDALKRKR